MKTKQKIWIDNGLNPDNYSAAVSHAMAEYANQRDQQWKAKIQAEIEEIEKEIKKLGNLYNDADEWDIETLQDISDERDYLRVKKQVLQKLLT